MTDVTATWGASGVMWQSLRWRLPAFISIVVFAVLAAIVYGAYREVRESLDRVQGERAHQAAQQIATMFGRATGDTVRQLESAAPSLRSVLADPSGDNATGARAILQRLAPGPARHITLWNAAGEVILELPDRIAVAAATDRPGLPRPHHPPAAGIGPLQPLRDGRTISDLAVAVTDESGRRLLGTVAIRSALAITPPDALTRLIGNDARILFGNQRGDGWTDLTTATGPPPGDVRVQGWREYRDGNGELQIAAVSHLPGTPWTVWVEFPETAQSAAATAFLWRIIRFGLLVGLGSVLIVGWLSIRLTRPVARITTAAESIAGGDYSQRVPDGRRDEIGRLARAFNTMAAQIGSAQRGLEERVESRTRDLNAALAALGERAQQRETYLATIVDSSADAIVGHDLDGVVTSWNKGAEQIFGYGADEMIGASIRRFVPDDRQDEDLRISHTIAAGASVPAFETERQTKDGRLIHVSITASPIIDAAGRVLGVSKVARDITRRTLAEREVRDQRDRAQQYLDTAQVILIAADRDGRIELINRFGCEVLGLPAEQIVGRRYAEFVPERLRATIAERVHAVRSGAVPVSDSVFVTASGEEREIEWRHTVRLDGDGRAIGTLSSGTDITERNRAVDALRSAEERMRFALETANVGIWDMCFATRTLQASSILESHYGFAPGTFAGTFDAYLERIHPDDRDTTLRAMRAAVNSGGDFAMQHRAVWPDGTVRSIRSAGRILADGDGAPTRGVGITLDVTEQRSLEEQFQQAQKMEAVGRLAGGVAHDFNNLLTAILGYCELLLEDLAVDHSTRSALTEIQKAGTRAAGLTRQLLAFSRKQIIAPELFDLNAVVTDMRPMLERLIGEDVAISVKTTIEPARVIADRGQIEQVIMNLAVNARDAMPGGGALLIEIANVELDEHYAATHLSAKAGHYVALIVTDTGTGIPPEVLTHLFEPFFTTKDKGKGTGLGLATVHGIIARSGGSVGVYSEMGKGTTFRVYLPATSATLESPLPVPVVSPPAAPATPATVLVVDDADGLRELARRILERQGYTVHTAANAREAITLFDRHQEIEILLTDIVMPGTSGPDLTRELMAKRPALRVIFMSGYTDDAISHHGVITAGTAFLDKPFTASALVKKVRDVQQM